MYLVLPGTVLFTVCYYMSNAISNKDSHILGGLLKTSFESEVLVLENFNQYLP